MAHFVPWPSIHSMVVSVGVWNESSVACRACSWRAKPYSEIANPPADAYPACCRTFLEKCSMRTCVLSLLGLVMGIEHMPAGQAKGGFQRDHPIIPPFERFYAAANSDDVKGGGLLLGELNCTSCHRTDDADLAKKSAPVLDNVGQRVRRGYLRKFIADPHKTKPGTTMPDVLTGLPEADRAEKVEALVHFLASTGTAKMERPERKIVAA